MRKIILYINSTFNGVVTGDPKGDKGNFNVWTNMAHHKSGTKTLLEAMETVDTLLFGRNTYEVLAVPEGWRSVKEWGTSISEATVTLGDKINNAHKLVVTGTHPLDKLQWGEFEAPEQLTGEDILEQIKQLKDGEGGDIMIFGSPTLVRALTDANLIDTYYFQVAPVVVNYGDQLFDGLKERKDFDLVDVKALEGGSFLVTYVPATTQA